MKHSDPCHDESPTVRPDRTVRSSSHHRLATVVAEKRRQLSHYCFFWHLSNGPNQIDSFCHALSGGLPSNSGSVCSLSCLGAREVCSLEATSRSRSVGSFR